MAKFDFESDSYGEQQPPPSAYPAPDQAMTQQAAPSPYPTQQPAPTKTGAPIPQAGGYNTNTPDHASQTSFGNPIYDQIGNYYQQVSGGTYNPTLQDVSQWGSNVNGNYLNQIFSAINSWWGQQPGSQQPQQPQTPAPAAQPPQDDPWAGIGQGNYRGYFERLFPDGGLTPAQLRAQEAALARVGISLAPNAQGVAGKIRLPDGRIIDVIQGADSGLNRRQWLEGGGGYGGGNPFTDPATQGYIDFLNQRVGALNTPQANPELDRLMSYLTKYFEQLQNPVYTDAQRDVINTQTIDPLERQRTARKQQVMQQMAARGMGPSDGPTIQALADVDRSFDQMRTGQQGQFAANEIGMGQQNQRSAVDIGSLAAQMRNGQFQQQDARSMQALGLARQVPDMAQQRLMTAISLLNGNQLNPAQLLGSMNQFNQTGMQQSQQDSQYWGSIMAQLAQIFGL